MAHIPFNCPFTAGNELAYIRQALDNMHISGDGVFTRKCRAFLERALDVPCVLLTTSGTHALEIAALLLEIQPGDEVIVPSFTHPSTVNAFVLRGARPVFADIRPDTLNLDESQLERLITPRTRAIVPVHYAGVGCEMDVILKIAEHHSIPVIEDNAHGLFGAYKGKPLGTFGCLSAASFHETKNVTCGEGGALLINDPRYIERAEILREKGTNRNSYFRGEVDKYTWVDLGSSYLPSDLLAAVLFAQLEVSEMIQDRRRRIWHYYRENLEGWAGEHNARLPIVPGHCSNSYHMFYVLMPSLGARQATIEHLGKRGIASVFHYLPLHLSKMGLKFGARGGDCPVAERVSECLLRLPFYNSLGAADLEHVVEAVRSVRLPGPRLIA